MFVTGQYNIFNNIVVDELRSRCAGTASVELDTSILEEFGVNIDEEIKVSNTVDLSTFMEVVRTPSINGKWFATAQLNTLTKKQNDWLKEYIKNPNENGVLALTSTAYKDYRFWLNNKKIPTDKYVSLIQLSFPRRDALKLLVNNLFLKHNAMIESRALDLFIIRMSSAYDQYEQIIEKICTNCLPDGYLQMDILDVPVLTYDKVFDSLRGIENFVIDDFIKQLTIPLTSDRLKSGAVIYKMMEYLVDEYGARKFVNTLLSKINELIEFRIAINVGYIPIIVNYNVAESKKLIGEENPISSKSDYQFKRLASLASQTSLLDWVYMKMILQNTNKFDESSYNRVLYSLITRTVLTESRLNNDIMIDNIFHYDLDYINSIKYTDTEYITGKPLELEEQCEEA